MFAGTPGYRRLLLGGAALTFALSVISGLLQLALSSVGCTTWPLCGLAHPALSLTAWNGQAQLALLLGAGGLVVAGNLVARIRRDNDAAVRMPLLAAAPLLAAFATLLATGERLPVPPVAMGAQGLALLLIACFIVPAVALAVPASQPGARLGGRSAAHRRTYGATALTLVGALWLMAASGSGLAGVPATTLYTAHLLTGGLVALLTAAAVWQTWRHRRGDRLLTRAVATMVGLLGLQVLIDATGAGLGQATAIGGLHLLLSTAIWCVGVVFAILALRRPAPALAAPATTVAIRQPSLISDYLSLTKPRVVVLLLLTTLAAMFITGEGSPSAVLVFWTMLGGYLAAGGAGAINCAFDRDIDINMGRTSRRPVPSGRISPRNALLFGLALCLLAVALLWAFATPLAALFAGAGAVYYALFYTRWLKRSTWQNIVIGGGAGAIPPLVGWTAVTGSLSLAAVLLFVIIFYWTPPHFWALALVKQKDYARAGVPMLPVVAGEAETRWQILLYSLLMVALSLLLFPIGAMGWIYLVAAILLGAIFLFYAWKVWRDGSQAHIWGLYKYSLLYLALLFVAMMVDHLVV